MSLLLLFVTDVVHDTDNTYSTWSNILPGPISHTSTRCQLSVNVFVTASPFLFLDVSFHGRLLSSGVEV